MSFLTNSVNAFIYPDCCHPQCLIFCHLPYNVVVKVEILCQITFIDIAGGSVGENIFTVQWSSGSFACSSRHEYCGGI